MIPSTSQLALMILLFPAAGAIVLAGRGWRLPRIVTRIVGPGVVWASFIVTVNLYLNHVSADFTYWTWIQSGSFNVPFHLLIDNLSIFMCLVITGVGGLIVTYAVGYMAAENDASYARFFTYMDIFVFSMLLLVLAPPPLRGARSAEGFCDERHRRRGHDPGRVRIVRQHTSDDVYGRLRSRHQLVSGERLLHARISPRHAQPRARCLPPAGRSGRQIRPDSAPHVATGRDGRPYPGQRPHPRCHHGHRGGLPGWAHAPHLRHRGLRPRRGGDRRRGHRALRRHDRDRPDRHQARAGVLDHEPDRIHVPGGWHRRLLGRLLPPPLARLLQSPPLHGRGQRHPRDARRAGHAQVRGPAQTAPPHIVVVPHRVGLARGCDSIRRLLLEGADPRRRVLETRRIACRRGLGVRLHHSPDHRLLHRAHVVDVVRRQTLA